MIRTNLIIWAHNISVDLADNSLSIFNVIETLTIPSLPAGLKNGTKFLVSLERDASDNPKNKLQVKITQNKKNLIHPAEFEMDFLNVNRYRLIINLPPLLLETDKPIIFNVYYKNKIIGTHEIECVRKVNYIKPHKLLTNLTHRNLE